MFQTKLVHIYQPPIKHKPFVRRTKSDKVQVKLNVTINRKEPAATSCCVCEDSASKQNGVCHNLYVLNIVDKITWLIITKRVRVWLGFSVCYCYFQINGNDRTTANISCSNEPLLPLLPSRPPKSTCMIWSPPPSSTFLMAHGEGSSPTRSFLMAPLRLFSPVVRTLLMAPEDYSSAFLMVQ